jgi:exosome complex component RRP46
MTLQIRSLPEEDSMLGVNTSLLVLPHLLHTALLALLSSSIPLRTIVTSVLVAIPRSTSKGAGLMLAPSAKELVRARPLKSVHVFAFSGDGKMVLNKSDGVFSFEEWDEACEMAEEVCCKEEGGVGLGEGMEVDGQSATENLEQWLREVVKSKVETEQRWRVAT